MKPAALRYRLANAQPGEVIPYHKGHLAYDTENGDYEAKDNRDIAQEAASNGLVRLSQKRVRKDSCEYLMTVCEDREYNWLRKTWPETLTNWGDANADDTED